MSTTAISGVSQAITTASVESRLSQRQTGGGKASTDSSVSRGLNLFASLLESLTQAVSQSNATLVSTPTGTASGATTASGSSSSGSSATSGTTSLAQDLQGFLHDLFHALRQTSEPTRRSGGGSDPSPIIHPLPRTPPTVTTNSGGSSGTTTTGTTGSGTTTTGSGSTTGTTTSGTSGTSTSGASSYGDHGIIAALKTLIQELGNSKVISGTNPNSGLSSGAITTLNTAFEKLLGDLGGTPGSSSDTSQLKSFLTNFLQDLQGNSSTASTVGSSIDTTA